MFISEIQKSKAFVRKKKYFKHENGLWIYNLESFAVRPESGLIFHTYCSEFTNANPFLSSSKKQGPITTRVNIAAHTITLGQLGYF